MKLLSLIITLSILSACGKKNESATVTTSTNTQSVSCKDEPQIGRWIDENGSEVVFAENCTAYQRVCGVQIQFSPRDQYGMTLVKVFKADPSPICPRLGTYTCFFARFGRDRLSEDCGFGTSYLTRSL